MTALTSSMRRFFVIAMIALFSPVEPPLAAQCIGLPFFGSPTSWTIGATDVWGIDRGDFDRDGDLDLVAVSGSTFRVMRNIGGGTFGTEAVISPGFNVLDILVADFDEDGRPDVAVTGTLVSSTSTGVTVVGQLRIYRNTATLSSPTVTFQSSTVISFGGAGRAIESADFNRDGILDLAVVDTSSINLHVFLGQGQTGVGNGTFTSPTTYTGTIGGHQDLAIADFDLNGSLDIAIVAFGSFGAVPVTIYSGDLSPSGVPDGTFTLAGTISCPGPTDARAILANDFNGDGFPDLAVSQDTVVTVISGNGTIFLNLLTTFPSGISADDSYFADFTGDGTADIALALNTTTNSGVGNVAMAIGQVNGPFTVVLNTSSGGGVPESMTAGDFNQDGILDVAVGKAVGSVAVCFGTCSPVTPRSVVVTSPQGGEQWSVGSTQAITWTKSASTATVDIEYSIDGGQVFTKIAENVVGQSYAWRIPAPGTGNAIVRVLPAGMPQLADVSNAAFTLNGPGQAASTLVPPTGCGTTPPFLFTNTPLFGGTLTINLVGANPIAYGGIFAAAVPQTPIFVAPGCLADLDLATLWLVREFVTDATGGFSMLLAVPFAVENVGLTFRLRAALPTPGVGIGAQLSNAVEVMLGF